MTKYFLTILLLYSTFLSSNQEWLISTESDPNSFILDCVNVINGDYCETVNDMIVKGPDSLVLQRFYSSKNAVNNHCGWRIFPQRFLILGKTQMEFNDCSNPNQEYLALAFTGERSGGILPYSGKLNKSGHTESPLKIDMFNQAKGAVNTYAKDINGQTNHKNNQLHCRGNTCELTLGDGTKRIYRQTQAIPSQIFGEEMVPLLSSQLIDPHYFLLVEEIFPSGNRLFFTYDENNHFQKIEMRNSNSSKILSWINFTYAFEKDSCHIIAQGSDEQELHYYFRLNNNFYELLKVEGSNCIPITYEYNKRLLTKKLFPLNRYLQIEYLDNKVAFLKKPNDKTADPERIYSFIYKENRTLVENIIGNKTIYKFDTRFQLITTEYYDSLNSLYKVEQQFWGTAAYDAGLLLAKIIADGNGRIHSYRSFKYDGYGNVIEEKLFGNLTGKQEVALSVSTDGQLLNSNDAECHLKTYTYSNDGFNLLTKFGDCKENQTLYFYKPKTNLLEKKFIYDKGRIKKRTFKTYNGDGICIKTIEDDGSSGTEANLYQVTERHIHEIVPKEYLPNVGLPEIILEKAVDIKSNREILISKFINKYDSKSNLVFSARYDANNEYVYSETKTYNAIGKLTSNIDAIGREFLYYYDEIGNEVTRYLPFANKRIDTLYDFHNQPIHIKELTDEGQQNTYCSYDKLGRKLSFTDQYGNITSYEYDDFNRLTKIIHPAVFDENDQVIQPTFSYAYDIFGNVTSVNDPLGYITLKSYNLRGDPTRIYYPDGTFEFFKYDPEGSLHRTISREQIVTIYEYDYLGRIVYEESSLAGDTGVVSYLTNKYRDYNGFRCIKEKENDVFTRYYFDVAGRISSIIKYESGQNEKSPEARITEIMYDSLGREHKRKIWFDIEANDYSLECCQYDLMNQIIEKRIEDSKGSILLQRKYNYDLTGHCTEEYYIENGKKNSIVKTIYNSYGEVVSLVEGSDSETKINYSISKNDLGQNILNKTILNPIGVQVEIEFDALARMTSISKKDNFNNYLSRQTIKYNAIGNKTSEMYDQIIDGQICDQQKTVWLYGPMGRVEEEVQAANSDLENRIYYKYNRLGQLISKKICNSNHEFKYLYNKNGKVEKLEAYDSENKLQLANSYSYDRRGNLISGSTQNKLTVNRQYNAFNQVKRESIKDGEGLYASEYRYDRKGRLKEILLPDSSKIIYSYDAVFGKKVERMTSNGTILYTHTYDEYNTQGNLLLETHLANIGSSQYAYDLNGKKTIIRNSYFTDEYERDKLGRIIDIKGNKTRQYAYNDLSQLIAEKHETINEYTYDSLDNRISFNGDTLFYNKLNQLLSDTHTEFTYNAKGNLASISNNEDEETIFTSDALSQIIAIRNPDKTSITYTYDPFGRILVEKNYDVKNKTSISTSRYYYLGYREIGTISQGGTIEALKIPGINCDKIASTSIAFEIKGSIYVPLYDMMNNVTCLINPVNNKIVEKYEYSAFGEETIFDEFGNIVNSSLVNNCWRFAEKRINEKTNLIYFGFRFFYPKTARWISQDPIRLHDGPNLYCYLHNNPLNYLDKFGLFTEEYAYGQFDEYFFGEVEVHCYCEKHRTCKRGGDIGKTVNSTLPKIVYDDRFEKFYSVHRSQECYLNDCYDYSACYELDDLPSLPDGLGIGFINGIWNNLNDSKASARYISNLAGGYNIHGVYNATHGGDVDIYEYNCGINYIATEPVRQLHNMWNSFFDKNSKNAKFLMICHSQGAVHVRNALLDYPPELRKRILVVAIAPGGYIYKETCANVIHYRAEWWRDFVPRLDSEGADREKDTISTLISHNDANAFDHEFSSPTYTAALRARINRYIRTNGKAL